MDNAIILKLYNGDISSKAYSASVLIGRFFSNTKGAAASITVWRCDSITLYEICANQFSKK